MTSDTGESGGGVRRHEFSAPTLDDSESVAR